MIAQQYGLYHIDAGFPRTSLAMRSKVENSNECNQRQRILAAEHIKSK